MNATEMEKLYEKAAFLLGHVVVTDKNALGTDDPPAGIPIKVHGKIRRFDPLGKKQDAFELLLAIRPTLIVTNSRVTVETSVFTPKHISDKVTVRNPRATPVISIYSVNDTRTVEEATMLAILHAAGYFAYEVEKSILEEGWNIYTKHPPVPGLYVTQRSYCLPQTHNTRKFAQWDGKQWLWPDKNAPCKDQCRNWKSWEVQEK